MPINTGSIYDQLLGLKIDLNFDDIPTPAYLQDKILECSDALRSIEKRMIEVTRELSTKEKDLKLEQSRLEIKHRSLLVNDPAIKKLPTGKERESAADGILEKEHAAVLALSNDVMELQNLLSSIRLVHQNLRMTNSDIRVLMRIMEQQVYKLNIGSKNDKEVRDLAASLSEVEQLEDELTPDDVESSSEGIEPDKPASRSEETTPTQADTVSDEAGSESGDDLNGISSFLTDDPEESGETTAPEDDQEEEEEIGPTQSAVGNKGPEEQKGAPNRTEAAKSGSGGSQMTGLDIDLSDLLGEAQDSPPAPAPKSVEKTPEVRDDGKAGGKAASVAKQTATKTPEAPPPKKEESKKAPDNVELDIDDIINSLDK